MHNLSLEYADGSFKVQISVEELEEPLLISPKDQSSEDI